MTPEEITRLCEHLASAHQEFSNVIRGASERPRTDIKPYGVIRSDRVSVWGFPQTLVTPQLYASLRNTEWLLQAGPDCPPVLGELTVSIYRKADLRRLYPPGTICYHVTERGNVRSISQHGLGPGYLFRRNPRDPRFPDSIYYIYTSPTIEHAKDWAATLGDPGDFALYYVKVSEGGFILLNDPCGGQPAFIVDAPPGHEIIPHDYLAGPYTLNNRMLLDDI